MIEYVVLVLQMTAGICDVVITIGMSIGCDPMRVSKADDARNN